MLNRIDLIIVAFVTFWCPAASEAQSVVEARLAKDQPPIVMAHRSANMDGYPENSLAWIEYGVERGVDMVHINPQLTADGEYVLMHDPTLNRMTNVEEVFPDGPPGGPTRAQRGGKDYVRDYTLAEIRRLRIIGYEDSGEHVVPMLSEAIDMVDGRALIALGLKAYEVESLAAVLQRHDTRNVLLFELYYPGTDQSKLRRLAEEAEISVGVALLRSRDYLKDLEGVVEEIGPVLRIVTVKSKGLSPEFILRARDLDLRVAVSGWASNEDIALIEQDDPGPWLKVLEAGLPAVTDEPDAVLQLLDR